MHAQFAKNNCVVFELVKIFFLHAPRKKVSM